MAEFYGQAMSDVPFYVVHTIKDESARITRAGALELIEAEVILLEDSDEDYRMSSRGEPGSRLSSPPARRWRGACSMCAWTPRRTTSSA